MSPDGSPASMKILARRGIDAPPVIRAGHADHEQPGAIGGRDQSRRAR